MLHDTLDELISKDVDIAHSLGNQVTYVESLDHTVHVNSDTILNLSTILKNEMIQSPDKYQQVIRDISWFYMTIYNSVLFLVIRQIEFAFLQLTQQVDEMLVAVQHILLGKLPVTIVNPKILHNILRNIFLCRDIMI
jgi:hypothetical protein